MFQNITSLYIPQHHGSYEELQKDIFSLSQMGGGSYPMPQGFSMGHGANMSAVGMRQDTMGELHKKERKKTHISF